MADDQAKILTHLRFVNTALVAVAVAALTARLISSGDRLVPLFSAVSVLICLYALLQPLIHK